MRGRKLLLGLFVVLLLPLPGSLAAETTRVYLEYRIEGGGQIHFFVFPGPKDRTYRATLISEGFLGHGETVDFAFADITEGMGNYGLRQYNECFDALDALFSGAADLAGQSSGSWGPSGSWTTLVFHDRGGQTEIENPELLDQLELLEEVVDRLFAL